VCLDPPPLRGADRNLVLVLSPGPRADQHYQELALEFGHPANGYKQNCHMTKCRFDNLKLSDTPQCGKEGVVLCGLRSRDVICL